METRRTLNEIECALADFFDIRKNIIVCNVSWGFLEHEADILVLSKTGYLTEIEIKRSLQDFKADFKKKKSFDKIKSFYFCIPESILEKCLELIRENNDYSNVVNGIITYNESLKLSINKRKIWGRTVKPLFIEEQLQIARLGAMRVWKLKKMINNK